MNAITVTKEEVEGEMNGVFEGRKEEVFFVTWFGYERTVSQSQSLSLWNIGWQFPFVDVVPNVITTITGHTEGKTGR